MAIQLDLANSQYGVPFAGAYFRIVNVVVGRTSDTGSRHNVVIDVAGYATKPTDENTRDVDSRRYHCTLSSIEEQVGDVFLAKCYAWVMSQEDMAGSTVAQ